MNDTNSVYQALCGESRFTLFTDDGTSISYCFLQIIIEIPIHFILALVSSLLLGSIRIPPPVYVKENGLKWLAHYFRLLLILAVICLTLTEYWFWPDQHFPPDITIITMGIKTIAWSLVFLVTYKIIKYSSLTKLSNLPAIMLLLLSTLISNGLHLQRNIEQEIGSNQLKLIIINSAVIIINLIYIITIWPRLNKWSIFKEQLIDTDLQNLLQQQQPMASSVTLYFDLDNHENSSWLSKLAFTWVNPLISKGFKQKIKSYTDLFPLPPSLSGIQAYEDIVKSSVPNESTNCHHHEADQYNLILWKTLVKTFSGAACSAAFLKVIADLANFAGPLVLERLIIYIEDTSHVRELDGFYHCLILLGSTLLSSLSISLFNFHSNNISLRMTSAINNLIYRKILLVRSDSLASSFSSGEVINLVSTDAGRVTNFYPSFVAFLTLPLQLLLTLYLLYSQLGLAFLAGLLFTVVIIPVNKWICDKIGTLNVKLLYWKDQRIKLMSEMLTGIRLVKMQAWESVFEREIEKLRAQEMKYMQKIKYLDALCVYFWATTPVLISISTFTTYVLLGNKLTAAKVFTSLALFNMLITPLNAFPWVLNGLIEACISVKRLQKFLDIKEMNLSSHYTGCLKGDTKLNSVGSFFKRDISQMDHRFTLGPIDLSVKSGDYIGIVGSVGSGKSSLFCAIIGEMYRTQGTFQINEHDLKNGIGFVPQDPWIQNASVRDNILFGQIYDSNRYTAVIEACALTEDLKILSNGDLSLVGDRGLTLSGGQKSRIALARAVYQDFDFYLLDDPYSSVDVHVADHIRTNCINGLLASKTKLICTHHTEFLNTARGIILMDNGLMIERGNTNILANVKPKENIQSQDEKPFTTDELPRDEMKPIEEACEKGRVKFDIYRHYWKSVGSILSSVILLFFVLMQATRTGSDWWLSHWTTSIKDQNSTDAETKEYLQVFAAIAVSNSLLTLGRAFLFAFGGILASLKIHRILLKSTLTTTLSFFDTTAFGRIINRFSSDMTNVDDQLPFNLNILLAQVFSLMASLIVTIYGIPWTAVVILPLFIPYYFIQKYYRWTSRDMKRLCAVSLSPIYSQLAETIQGMSVIRAFAASGRFITEFLDKVDISNSCQYASSAASQWLNLRLQILGVIFSSGVAFTAVILHYFSIVEVNAGLVGLALAYSLSITALLNGVVQMFSQVEVDLISVERIQQYVKSTDKESDDGFCPENWPCRGDIAFENVSLRYLPESPLALDEVSLTIHPRQHVGIVGRTGSGKSTLLQTLFRLKDIEKGRILIDGIDISTINVRHLRSSLFIVPQDSYLFSGSIRHNLDPFHRHSDEEIWKALRQCQADSLILSLGSLNATISENGRDLSFGQRQLICLTRALLSRAKIICFDEITSSIDKETDQLLERTIRTSFKHSTILTVAHKIEMVLHCDRVLVMESGKIVEDGNPQQLKMNLDSKFYKLWSSMNSRQ